MSLNLLKDIKTAYAQLNPHDVRRMAERPLSVGVVASTESGYDAIERFLSRAAAEPASALGGFVNVSRVSAQSGPGAHDLVICEEGTVGPAKSFTFRPSNPNATVDAILTALPDLEIALARHFTNFRSVAVNRIIQRTSKENAMFSVVTALPNVVPNLLELPWAVGEFATDTAFLTMNQVRMAFLIAAANGKDAGYGEQKVELAAIAASAFGWRALARELIGHIPLGGGLIPKAAVAFAATYVIGISLDRVHRTGAGMNRAEQRAAYQEALERGKGVVKQLIPGLKNRNVA